MQTKIQMKNWAKKKKKGRRGGEEKYRNDDDVAHKNVLVCVCAMKILKKNILNYK